MYWLLNGSNTLLLVYVLLSGAVFDLPYHSKVNVHLLTFLLDNLNPLGPITSGIQCALRLAAVSSCLDFF